MVALGVIIVAIGGRLGAEEESAASLDADLPRLISDCNRVVEAGKRQAMSACETLAKANLLGRAEPAASAAYQRRQADLERWAACQRGQLPVPSGQRLSCPRAAQASSKPEGTTNDRISVPRAGCEQPAAPDVPADIVIGSRADKRLSREIGRFVSDSAKYVSCLHADVADPTTVAQREAEALHAVTTLFDLYEVRVGHSDELIAELTELAGAVNPSHLRRAAAIQRAVESEAIQTLNAAIRHINGQRLGEARAAVVDLDLDGLSSFERSEAERVLYTIAYEEEKFEEAREHVRRSIDAGGLSGDDRFKAQLALTNIEIMLHLRDSQLQGTPSQVVVPLAK